MLSPLFDRQHAIPNSRATALGPYKLSVPSAPLGSCNALNLGVEFFRLFFHQIQALIFSFLVLSLSLDLFQSYSGVRLGIPV
jgi:hypothetical protein